MNRKKKIILSAVLTAVGICAVILALVWRPQKPDAGLSPSHSAATVISSMPVIQPVTAGMASDALATRFLCAPMEL